MVTFGVIFISKGWFFQPHSSENRLCVGFANWLTSISRKMVAIFFKWTSHFHLSRSQKNRPFSLTDALVVIFGVILISKSWFFQPHSSENRLCVGFANCLTSISRKMVAILFKWTSHFHLSRSQQNRQFF